MRTSNAMMRVKNAAIVILAEENPGITVREACDRLKSEFGFSSGMDARWASKVMRGIRQRQGLPLKLNGTMRGRGYNDGKGPIQGRRRVVHLDAEATSC